MKKLIVVLVIFFIFFGQSKESLAATNTGKLPQTFTDVPFVLNHGLTIKIGDVIRLTWSSSDTFNNSRIKINNIVLSNTSYSENMLIGETLNVTKDNINNFQSKSFTIGRFNYGAITLRTVTVNGVQVDNMDIVHDELTGLSVNQTFENVELVWQFPEKNGSYLGIKIYKDGVLLKTIEKNTKSFTDTNIIPGKEYEYRVSAYYPDDFITTGITKKVKVDDLPIIKEVTSIKAVPSYNRVNLSWELGEKEYFDKVVIFRETIETEKTSLLQNVLFGKKVFAAASPIFETNGTYFNDLTVKPLTTYKYKLVSIWEKGRLESEGVSVTTKTLAEPKPELGDTEFEKEKNGDYTAKWETPVTGTIKVFVGGKLYKEVSASAKFITIPKADLVYDFLGEPDVKLQPVSETGLEGGTTAPNGVEAPFSVTDLVKSGNSLLWYVAPFLLLALSFLLVPKLRNMIVNSVGKKKKEKENSDRRIREEKSEPREKEDRQTKKERKEQRKGKEYLEKIEKTETKEIQKQEKIVERKREPRESRIRSEKQIRYLKEARAKREPIERFREPRKTREPREPRARRER